MDKNKHFDFVEHDSPDFHGGEYAGLAPSVRAAVYPAVLKPKERPGLGSKLVVWTTLAALSWSFVLGLVWCVVKLTRAVFGSLGWS